MGIVVDKFTPKELEHLKRDYDFQLYVKDLTRREEAFVKAEKIKELVRNSLTKALPAPK